MYALPAKMSDGMSHLIWKYPKAKTYSFGNQYGAIPGIKHIYY